MALTDRTGTGTGSLEDTSLREGLGALWTCFRRFLRYKRLLFPGLACTVVALREVRGCLRVHADDRVASDDRPVDHRS
jgi:hypothetical protein